MLISVLISLNQSLSFNRVVFGPKSQHLKVALRDVSEVYHFLIRAVFLESVLRSLMLVDHYVRGSHVALSFGAAEFPHQLDANFSHLIGAM